MKRNFLVVFMAIATALCMAFGFTACGEKNPDETGNNPSITDPSGNQGEQGTQKPDEGEQGGAQKPEEGEQEPETYTEGLCFTEMYGEDGTTVIGYSVGAGEAADEEEIVIPSKYNDLPVLSISRSEEDKAFWNKLYEELMKGGQDDFMQKLMQKYTFYNCENLKKITIPNSVTTIGGAAFEYSEKLASIYIPSNVTFISKSDAFFGCGGLTKIEVDPDNKGYHVKDNCLIETKSKILIAGCNTSKIPDDGSVTSIGISAFSGRIGLTSVTIPDSVTSIGYEAFWYCSGLKEVDLGHGVTSLGEGAFYYCSGLTSVTIPNSVTEIGRVVFAGCDNLKNVHFETPNGWEAGSISLSGLNDPAQAAEYLTDTYCEYSWQRG